MMSRLHILWNVPAAALLCLKKSEHVGRSYTALYAACGLQVQCVVCITMITIVLFRTAENIGLFVSFSLHENHVCSAFSAAVRH